MQCMPCSRSRERSNSFPSFFHCFIYMQSVACPQFVCPCTSLITLPLPGSCVTGCYAFLLAPSACGVIAVCTMPSPDPHPLHISLTLNPFNRSCNVLHSTHASCNMHTGPWTSKLAILQSGNTRYRCTTGNCTSLGGGGSKCRSACSLSQVFKQLRRERWIELTLAPAASGRQERSWLCQLILPHSILEMKCTAKVLCRHTGCKHQQAQPQLWRQPWSHTGTA